MGEETEHKKKRRLLRPPAPLPWKKAGRVALGHPPPPVPPEWQRKHGSPSPPPPLEQLRSAKLHNAANAGGVEAPHSLAAVADGPPNSSYINTSTDAAISKALPEAQLPSNTS